MHNLVNSPWSIVLSIVALSLGIAFLYPVNIQPFAHEDDSLLLRAGKGVIGVNFLVQSYMLVAPPVVYEGDISGIPIWTGGSAAGMAVGPLLLLQENLWGRDRVLRHEYQHYCQAAVLTVAGISLLYNLDSVWSLLQGKSLVEAYRDNWFEKDARKHERDELVFRYILLRDGKFSFETSEVVNYE